MRLTVDGHCLICAGSHAKIPDEWGQVRQAHPAALRKPWEPRTRGASPAYGSRQWWDLPGESGHRRACEPDMPLMATTLILPRYKVQVQPAGALAGCERMVLVACEALSLAPDQ